MHPRYWTEAEDDILRKHFRAGGEACRNHLPHRSIPAIYARAHKLGLRAHPDRTGPRQRWHSNEHIDDAIRRAWQKPYKGFTIDLARRIGRPKWWCIKRAVALGCTVHRLKEPEWSKEEIELLREHAHKTPAVIKRILKRHGFHRTETAIVVKRKRLGCDTIDDDNFSATALAQLLGVDGHKVVRWIRVGALPAKRKGTNRLPQQGGDAYLIHRRAIRNFIIAHPGEIDLRMIADKYWFIDLLGGGL